MSVSLQNKARPAFRNTGQLAKVVGRPRLTVDALTVLSGTERVDAGRCRLYTATDQAAVEDAAEVYSLCEGLDVTGRKELRSLWSEFARGARSIAERQRSMIDPTVSADADAVA